MLKKLINLSYYYTYFSRFTSIHSQHYLETQELPCCPPPPLISFLQSVQFSSVTQSCPTLCDPVNCSTPGLPVHHHLPEFTQTHVH